MCRRWTGVQQVQRATSRSLRTTKPWSPTYQMSVAPDAGPHVRQCAPADRRRRTRPLAGQPGQRPARPAGQPDGVRHRAESAPACRRNPRRAPVDRRGAIRRRDLAPRRQQMPSHSCDGRACALDRRLGLRRTDADGGQVGDQRRRPTGTRCARARSARMRSMRARRSPTSISSDAMKRRGDLVGVVRIHDQRVGQFARRAGELAEDQRRRRRRRARRRTPSPPGSCRRGAT